MTAGDDLPRVEVTSRAELRAWLLDNHSDSGSIWLVTWRTAHPDKHVSYNAIVEEALCFGWVDSLPRKLDESRTMLLLSRRKATSGWSAANKKRVEELIARGLMNAAGIASIATAKSNGSWSMLDDVERLEMPEDLTTELRRYANAEKYFASFPRSVKRSILEWIKQAKRPETRQKRISETARLADRNIRANQARQ